MKFKTVSVIGLGYIGLPTAAVIAGNDVQVLGVDISKTVVDTINCGQIHIVEPGLDSLVKQVVSKGYLKAYCTPQKADAFLIAVPTPFKGDNNEPDLKYIESASKAIAPKLEKGNLIILESTSPVGTTEKMSQWLSEVRQDLIFPHQSDRENQADIFIAHCPERVLPGQVLKELEENDRIIGGLDHASTEAAKSLYKLFVKSGKCIGTDARTAEMSKLTENAFRDVNIAFANELSIICDKENIDVWELISLANRHPRVDILQPGCGVGGHCIAVDPWFIVNKTPELSKIIHQARRTNDYKPKFVVEKIEFSARKKLNPVIACLGLSFKPNIDDLRESPALEIVKKLSEKYSILAVEPNIKQLPECFANNMNIKLTDTDEALLNADVIAILVDHKEFSFISSEYRDKSVLNFVGKNLAVSNLYRFNGNSSSGSKKANIF